ncbi:SPOSA6832_03921 [Sporobolomyces salmonicolor]|uniref:SPOSA6832_03921-mRNA-1:cds n=1 Tax=Sporidiobolus salmonicolor TaxID=5005 RepID=A0A0D6EPX1_SPOSA|nr:SPOSA6832_03921 [Sporobolomyces salmonicolor]
MDFAAFKGHASAWTNDCPLTTLALALVGAGWLGSYALSFARMLVDLARPGIPLKRFGAKKGAWAVVTGATAGIGRDFALQLAAAGFNIFLASRTTSKLEEISQEITAKFPNVKTQVHSIDFSSPSADYAALGKAMEPLDIGVLINNVGKSYEEPTFFQDLPDQDIADIVEINVNATLKVTKLVLPGMISRKRGLILSVGSFASLIPSPLLAVYSGSKAFLSTWSQALGSELKGTGVEVELLNTYFVVSKLSKIRRSSWMIPTPKTYVRTCWDTFQLSRFSIRMLNHLLVGSVLSHIGVKGGAVGQPHISTPYHGHAPVQVRRSPWVVDHLFSHQFWLNYNRKLHLDIRRRALRKRERDAGKAVKGA